MDYENSVYDELDEKKDVQKIIEEKDMRMVRLFRKVFLSEDGKIVLRQILTDLNYFDECKTNDDVVRNNYAKFVIKTRLMIDNKDRLTNAVLEARDQLVSK
ncbi:MAG: hypothetical protein J6S85_12635 [Methanobrevibacter sp.]|nr:hypothetical protein [Methanobrevibacter sp.]